MRAANRAERRKRAEIGALLTRRSAIKRDASRIALVSGQENRTEAAPLSGQSSERFRASSSSQGRRVREA